MKKLMSLAAVLTLVAMTSMAFAQDPGDVGVFFDLGGTTTSATPPAFTTTNLFYVATFDLPQISGYEFAITVGDPNIIIFAAADMTNPGLSINVGTPPLEWTVGIGLCAGNAGVINLVQFTYGFFVASVSDVLICVGPADPASIPGVPAWLRCDGTIIPFGVAENGGMAYPNGCGVLYPSADPPVGADVTSWSSVKSKF